MIEYIYPATTSVDEGGRVLITFPDIHGATTDGADMGEAFSEAQDCLAESIAAAMVAGEDIPEPSKAKRGQSLIPLPASVAVKVILYTAMREQNRSNSWLARQLNVDEKEARRMLNPHHATKLPRMHKALHALGKDMVIGVRDTGANYQ